MDEKGKDDGDGEKEGERKEKEFFCLGKGRNEIVSQDGKSE